MKFITLLAWFFALYASFTMVVKGARNIRTAGLAKPWPVQFTLFTAVVCWAWIISYGGC